jgi:hypothetical protein
MLRIHNIENKLHKELKTFMNENGFVEDTLNRYIKQTSLVTDTVGFRIVKIGFDFGVIYNFSRKYQIIESILENLNENPNYQIHTFWGAVYNSTIFIYRTYLDETLENTMGYSLLQGGGIYLKSNEIDTEILKFKNIFTSEYENLILPFLKQTENIHWLDKHINPIPYDIEEVNKYFSHQLIDVKRIIIAKLVNNPNFERYYQESVKSCEVFIQQSNDEATKKELEILNIVYERLKDIQPLENPILI